MNFLDIDNFITVFLYKNIDLYNEAKNRYEIYKSLDLEKFGGRIFNDIKKDLKLIEDLKFCENILFLYKNKTSMMIKKFLHIMKTPIKKDAISDLRNADMSKRIILHEYLSAIKTCIPYEIFDRLNIIDEKSIDMNINNYCENCENTEEFIKDNDILICKKCFSEVIKMAYYNNRSYNVNVSKCNYDRISHFKECLKQYQGKQNTFISPSVYFDIENALSTHGIISNDKNESKIDRFFGVKKSHTMYFLKELGYSKHYDDYILIHTNLTGQPSNNISHLEEILISDFEKISEKYALLYNNAERKNFINIQFILYCLLIKHDHVFDHNDFTVVKSIDRKMERDKICKNIFESLGWEYKVR